VAKPSPGIARRLSIGKVVAWFSRRWHTRVVLKDQIQSLRLSLISLYLLPSRPS